jgi:diguanylate cyclase (GGDEF)-like protein/PAS domain S-box-containing protein
MNPAFETQPDLSERASSSRPAAVPSGPSAVPSPPPWPAGEDAQVRALFRAAGDLLATISVEGRFVLLNPAWQDVLGWTHEQLTSMPLTELVHPDDLQQTTAVMLACRGHEAELVNFTNRLRHRDGSWRWLLWSARCDGERWHAAAKDVTDRMWLERQALHDPLTKLPNRLLLMDRAHQALARLHRSHGLVALLFIDLDRFKAVNDNLGHALGDHLLTAVGERLATTMRDSDTVARLGGDEFVILAEDLETDAEAINVAERVLHALEEPFAIGSAEVSMLASVGVSVSHDPDTDPEDLLREADVAMYRAKRAGGYGLELFDERLRREVTAHLDVESRLRDALPRSEMTLDYQPIVSLSDGDVAICEALLRWRPHEGASVEPEDFLPLAEESELIVQIGDWALNAACEQASSWRQAGRQVAVAVNVSSRCFAELDLTERVQAALECHGIAPETLWLEVGEQAVMRDRERAQAALEELKRVGVKLVLDGFGSGDSRLTIVPAMPFDAIKIDRALIATADGDDARRAVVVAIVALARHTGLQTIAVGIETQRQLQLARELGCDLAQGFLLHPPQIPQLVDLGRPRAIRSRPRWRLRARRRPRP